MRILISQPNLIRKPENSAKTVGKIWGFVISQPNLIRKPEMCTKTVGKIWGF